MNILIISDDGPNSLGLEILKESARSHFGPSAPIVTMTTSEGRCASSFSISPLRPKGDGLPHLSYIEKTPSFYVVEGTPVDCLYLAVLWPEHFFVNGGPDILLTGVNHGANVGIDVLHSGTTSVAMLGSYAFGLPSIAFSQDVSDGSIELPSSPPLYFSAEKYVPKVLSNSEFVPGTCLNVNFPLSEPKGYLKVVPAPYSRWVPTTWSKSHSEKVKTLDIPSLQDGWITISDLELSHSSTLSH